MKNVQNLIRKSLKIYLNSAMSLTVNELTNFGIPSLNSKN